MNNISLKQLSKNLDRSYVTLWCWAKQGKIPAFQSNVKYSTGWRVLTTDIETVRAYAHAHTAIPSHSIIARRRKKYVEALIRAGLDPVDYLK